MGHKLTNENDIENSVLFFIEEILIWWNWSIIELL